MGDNSIIFKGSIEHLTIIMREEEDYSTILEQIKKKIASSGRFFKGATLSVRYKGRKLTKDQEDEIYKVLKDKSGANISSFEEDTTQDIKPEGKKDPPFLGSKIKMSNFYFKDLEEGVTKFHRGTIRSGQSVRFDGNLVVIGDVNPGGEVVATGNIVVMGLLRGVVHAGSNGNKRALVVALALQPTQLRIADIITRSPDENEAAINFIPELAYVKDGMVYTERYLPSRMN
ncbi:MAG: septum site-determining protein MinC [Clostridium sp.]|nr:septum site-determining protein MinC [Clostridium sp.]